MSSSGFRSEFRGEFVEKARSTKGKSVGAGQERDQDELFPSPTRTGSIKAVEQQCTRE